ncbi:MAG: DUF5615 family PIN-like protein [Segetibacter sp.]
MWQSEIDLSQLTFWFDAHLLPSIAKWMIEKLGVRASSLRNIGLRDADDIDNFKAAKEANIIFVSKDKDLKNLIDAFGPPPKLIWLTCGNTSNKTLRQILYNNFDAVLDTLIINDLPFIEITN